MSEDQTPNDNQIPQEARIAEHASAIGARPDWTRIAEHTARKRAERAERCPPMDLSQRLWPLFLALRVLGDGMDRAAIVAVFAPFAQTLLATRIALLISDLRAMRAKLSEHETAPAGIRNEGAAEHSRQELERSMRFLAIMQNAAAQLSMMREDNPTACEDLITGTLCPTCLSAPLEGCRSGWIEGEKPAGHVHPLSLECPTRARRNGWAPRTWDRDQRKFLEVVP